MFDCFLYQILFPQVQFGNFKISVGRVEYDVSQQFQFPMEAIAGIAAAGGFLVFIIVIILIIYRRKNTQSERIYKKMQVQLDNLESNVRNECKQGNIWGSLLKIRFILQNEHFL